MLIGNIVFFIVMAVIIISIVKNIVELSFTFENYSIHKKRLSQLKREVDKQNLTAYEYMEKYTEPIVNSLFPRLDKHLPSLRLSNMQQLKKDIKMIGWDDTFSPESFIATGIGLKIIGIFVLLLASILISGPFKLIGIGLGFVLMFILDNMFKGEVKGLKQQLFSEFPDFIRIVSGYLSADVPFVQAISDSIKYVGKEWKPILQQFVVDCDTINVNTALNNMKENVDLFEVKEFVALVRLTLEQGGNVREGFVAQAEKIGEMQKNIMIIKVGKRKTLSTILQGPLLLANVVILALPTVGNMMTGF